MGECSLQGKAEKALAAALPEGFAGAAPRLEVLPQDGTMVLFRQFDGEAGDCLAMLRRNGEHSGEWSFAPLVLDPETGRPAARHVVPFKLWSRPGGLRAFLAGEGDGLRHPADHGPLRLLKGIADGVPEHRCGRAGRFRLLLEGPRPILTVQVFPSGLIHSREGTTPGRLAGVASVLMARTGIAGKPYPFHLLRSGDFFRVERAVNLSGRVNEATTLKMRESELLRGAEEDRKIVAAMLSEPSSWERFLQPGRR